MLAQMFDIPCYNLANDRDYERVVKFLEEWEDEAASD